MEKSKKYDERNKVNYLDGKTWIKNAINFWEVDTLEDLEKKMLDFVYKKRSSGKCYSNLISESKLDDIEYDATIFKVANIEEIRQATKKMIDSSYNSYHYFVLENIVEKDVLLSKYIVDICQMNELEYRGRIIVYFKNDHKYLTLQLFLNRLEEKFFHDITSIENYKIIYKEKKEHFIYSKSKIDKIGLKHPAPYSYNDIEELCDLENIENTTILDPFLGIGSTIIGTYKRNNYNIGIELNKDYVDLISDRFDLLNLSDEITGKFKIVNGDSLKEIKKLKCTIDNVITSPPYFNILKNKSKGIRHDNTQTRQGIEFYSNSSKDIGNLDNYDTYLKTMKKLFNNIKEKMSQQGKIYIVISDFTVDKKEKDIHSDFIKIMCDNGYCYTGTSYIIQNQKSIYPFGYPYKIVLNHIFQYIMCFEV